MLWTPVGHGFEILLYSNLFIKPFRAGKSITGRKFPRGHALPGNGSRFLGTVSSPKCGWNVGHYLLQVLIRNLALVLCQNIFKIMYIVDFFNRTKMADGESDGNNCSAHSDQESNISSASNCESCNKLKLKLNEVLSELSSTYAIIDLLQMEINSKHSRSSEGDNSSDIKY
jgi:hypothetical protein